MSNTVSLMMFDNTDWTSSLTKSWFMGGKLYKTFRAVDLTQGVSSWENALDWLLEVAPGKKISQIQFWGHGLPGQAYIGQDVLDARALHSNTELIAKLNKVKTRLTPNALFWFRTCLTFAGQTGQQFAKEFATTIDCRVAGHTFIIGPFQSGLHSLPPGATPYWPVKEGLTTTKNKYIWSNPMKPNTISCLRSTVPSGW